MTQIGAPERDGKFGVAMIWSFAQSIGTQLIGLVVSFVLASLMGPEVFGVLALALAYIVFIQMLLQQGLVPAIIQQRDQTDEHLDTAFIIVMVSTGVLSVASVALAPLWASINDEPDLLWVTIALAALVPIRGLIVVQDAILRRNMNFRSLAQRQLIAVVVGAVVGIGMAVLDFGIWALVGQQLANALVDVILLWRMSSWRPRRRFSRPAARELWRYSLGASAASLAVYVATWANVVVMGFFFGTVAIGLFRFAGTLVQRVYGSISAPFLQVSLPEFARHQHDPKAFGERVVDLVRMSAIVTLPVFAAVAAGADDILDLAGDEWAPAARPLAIMCVVMAVGSLAHFSTTLLQSLSRVRLLAIMHWFDAILAVIALVIAGFLLRDSSVDDQLLGVALTSALNAAVTIFLFSVPIMVVVGQAPLRKLFAAPLMPTVASLGGYLAGRWIRSVPGASDLPAFFRAGLTGGTTVVVAAVVMYAFMPDARQMVSERLAQLRSWRGAAAAEDGSTVGSGASTNGA